MTFVRDHIRAIVAALVAVGLSLLPRLLFGQDAPPADTGPEVVGGVMQIVWMVTGIAGGIAVAGLAWLIGILIAWLGEKYGQTVWAGFVQRFLEALEDELQLSWDELKAALADARSRESEGGEQITAAEQARLGKIVWAGLKQRYGGGSKLVALGARILGGDGERILKGQVFRRVTDAVAGQASGKPGPRRAVVANP